MKKESEYNKKYRESHPWARKLHAARDRCNNSNHMAFKSYGAKGIRCLLTISEIKILWERDSADDMKRPSLDRINVKGNYTIDNCRFIELSENIRLGNLGKLKNKKLAKLTKEEVIEIRKLLDDNVKQAILAYKYGVDPTTISNIKTRKSWAYLKQSPKT